MNKLSHSVLWIVTVLVTACNIQPKQEPIEEVIDRGLKASTEQALLMAKELETQNGRLPKTINKEGKLETSDYSWWCSGFFPGELWYLYEYNPTPEMKKYAEMYTDRVEEVKHITYSHDVGFMLYCSYGNGYRLTGKPEYKDVMLTGANSLEFFSWASKASGDDRFRKMAISHADKTMLHHFRDDYSCYHVVSYDTITGMPHKKQTHQGAADESAWARGQAWALYGFTMMYRESGKPDYLNHAKHIASFIMNHPNMPVDKIPYWDFDAPGIPNVPRDASAAAIMASALIELSQLDKSTEAKSYLDFAEQQIRSLTSPDYLAAKGTNCNFALMHSTGHFPGKSEVDVPLSYADYYYVEALMRLRNQLKNKSL